MSEAPAAALPRWVDLALLPLLNLLLALAITAALMLATGNDPAVALTALAVGKAEIRRQTSRGAQRVALLAFGPMLAPALAAADELDATVANMRFVRPLDTELAVRLAHEHDLLVTIEEGVVAGGAGSAVAEDAISADHFIELIL